MIQMEEMMVLPMEIWILPMVCYWRIINGEAAELLIIWQKQLILLMLLIAPLGIFIFGENMSTTNYDLIVIGSGPAGYEGAIYASQLGMKVALIEKEQWLGGTCLNVGCIPAKSMLQSATMFQKAKKFAEYGVKIAGADHPELDFPQVNKRRDEIVKTMTNGVGFLMKKNKVDVIRGVGSIAGKGQVEVAADGKKTTYGCKNILIATGSRARHLPQFKVDGKLIVTSEEIWAFDKVPETMAVLGGGVIGCEFASAYGRYGTKVTILEMADQICPTEDHETAAELTKALKKQNCEILTGVKTKSIIAKGNKVEIMLEGETTPRIFEMTGIFEASLIRPLTGEKTVSSPPPASFNIPRPS